MKPYRLSMLLFVLACNIEAGYAQPTVVGSTQRQVTFLNSLGTAGPKLVETLLSGTGTVTVFNLDLTPYRVLTVPLPVPPFTYGYMSYITEDLFDTDPATIEYAIMGQSFSSSYVAIIREDGTPLYFQTPARFKNTAYPDFSTDGIINTASGTFMLLDSSAYGGSVLLQLPGTLPCPNCDGSLVMGGGSQLASPSTGLTTTPNPASTQTRLGYPVQEGAGHVQLVLTDDLGRVVHTQTLDRSGWIDLQTANLPNGDYLWYVESDGQRLIGAQRLVVMH